MMGRFWNASTQARATDSGRVNALKIGSVFPDFTAQTTMGPIRLCDWTDGHWTFLFVHPLAATPVCTSELVCILRKKEEFERLGTKVLGLNSSPLLDQHLWHHDCNTVFDKEVWFPSVTKVDAALLESLGSDTLHGTRVLPRKTIILDPQRRIRLHIDYPIGLGRNVSEILRSIEALQMADRDDLMVPADWRQGDPFVAFPKAGEYSKDDRDEVTILPYLTIVSSPFGGMAKNEH